MAHPCCSPCRCFMPLVIARSFSLGIFELLRLFVVMIITAVVYIAVRLPGSGVTLVSGSSWRVLELLGTFSAFPALWHILSLAVQGASLRHWGPCGLENTGRGQKRRWGASCRCWDSLPLRHCEFSFCSICVPFFPRKNPHSG